MFFRIVTESFRRQRRRKAIATVAVMLGTAVAVALLNVALDIGDKVNQELKAYGANLLILPKGDALPLEIGGEDLSRLKSEELLSEGDLPKIKDIFWRNNILAFAPFLDIPITTNGKQAKLVGTWFNKSIPLEGESFSTGIRQLNSSWKVEGRWVDDEAQPPQAMIGQALARALRVKPGDVVRVVQGVHQAGLSIVGLVTAGGAEDDQLFTTLRTAQKLTGHEGKVRRVLVSALTTPEDKVYERLGRNPRELPPSEFERWMCTPFVSSIAYQLGEVFPSAEVKPIRRIVESEGQILNKTKLMMALIAAMALAASALAVMSTMMTTVLERRVEIGLMKAVGAGNGTVVSLFLTEAFLIGFIGGLLGCGLGMLLARVIGTSVFNSSIEPNLITLPLAIIAAEIIALIGCAAPARTLLSFRPVEILRNV
jgi:putative ABC transport system permease protein